MPSFLVKEVDEKLHRAVNSAAASEGITQKEFIVRALVFATIGTIGTKELVVSEETGGGVPTKVTERQAKKAARKQKLKEDVAAALPSPIAEIVKKKLETGTTVVHKDNCDCTVCQIGKGKR